SGTGRASAPYLASLWSRSNLEVDPSEEAKLQATTKTLIEQTLQQQVRRPEPLLPAFSPIATGGKLIYRSFYGIHAVDVRDGKVEWSSKCLAALDQLLGDLNKKQDVDNWYKMYQQGSDQTIIFENTTIGTLSTDNTRVYAVDDLGLPPHPNFVSGAPFWGGGAQISGAISELANRSRLVAVN